jgi:hypothetical protein
MFYSKMTRHYLTVSTPGGRDTTSVRTESNNKLAKVLRDKARDIIATDSPQKLERCSQSPAWYVCKHFCGHTDTCHGDKAPPINCRTCAHSTPHIIKDSAAAAWRCHLTDHAHDIPLDVQRIGCTNHIYNPGFLEPWAEVIGADPSTNSITYTHKRTKSAFTNGNGSPGFFTSHEIAACDKALLGDDNINELKTQLNAKVVS